MALDTDRVAGHRVRPARRPRWRLYTPALTALILATAAIAAAQPLASLGAQATLGAHATWTLAAGLVVGLATIAAALCDRPPARWFIAGSFAVSVGANLTATRWLFVPLVVLGVVGVVTREIERAFEGLTLGTSAITLHRPLKDPLTVDYEDVHAVHTTVASGEAGTLILETEHGTVTARDVPAVDAVQARVEARLGSFEIEEPEQAAREVRQRIQDLVRGRSPS